MLSNDEFWRRFINSLPIEHDLPDNDEDEVEEEVEVKLVTTKESELLVKEAAVIRLQMDIYLISPTEGGKKAYMVNGNQVLEDCGVMTIQEALTMIKNRNKKKS